MLSQDNGLGTFYWEGAWIPVKAGWTNWEYNKQIADQYGTGWASKGALGYFPDSKMYYKGKQHGVEQAGIIRHCLILTDIHCSH